MVCLTVVVNAQGTLACVSWGYITFQIRFKRMVMLEMVTVEEAVCRFTEGIGMVILAVHAVVA